MLSVISINSYLSLLRTFERQPFVFNFSPHYLESPFFKANVYLRRAEGYLFSASSFGTTLCFLTKHRGVTYMLQEAENALNDKPIIEKG